MTSTNQTSLILLALDKALIDNAAKLARRPGHDRALTLAVFKTIMGAPVPPATEPFFERPGVKRGLARVEEMEARASERSPNAS